MDSKFIHIDQASMVPKYRQIIDSIHEALQSKVLKAGDKLPSINDIAFNHKLSRDTVLAAYNDLQARGVVAARPGKGYYMKKSAVGHRRKIFLLFDKLTPYKEILYESFVANLDRKDKVEMFFHNFNTSLFESLIRESVGNYTEYVIMPIPTKTIAPVLNFIPAGKLYILDRARKLYGKKYPSVCQNFEEDVFNALVSGVDRIKMYKTFFMIIPEQSHFPATLIKGFKRFCEIYSITHEVIKQAPEEKIKKGHAYLILDDRNLVKIVKAANSRGFVTGKDVGIISYNDTPLKSIAGNGITTISTDFELMGENMAELILNKSRNHIDNPSSLIRRKSL